MVDRQLKARPVVTVRVDGQYDTIMIGQVRIANSRTSRWNILSGRATDAHLDANVEQLPVAVRSEETWTSTSGGISSQFNELRVGPQWVV